MLPISLCFSWALPSLRLPPLPLTLSASLLILSYAPSLSLPQPLPHFYFALLSIHAKPPKDLFLVHITLTSAKSAVGEWMDRYNGILVRFNKKTVLEVMLELYFLIEPCQYHVPLLQVFLFLSRCPHHRRFVKVAGSLTFTEELKKSCVLVKDIQICRKPGETKDRVESSNNYYLLYTAEAYV